MFRQRGKARSVGRPGGSAWTAYRMQRARYLNMSWQSRAVIMVLTAASGAILALVAGYSPITGGLLTAGILFAAAVVFTAPDALKIALVFFAYAPATLFLGSIYSSAMVFARTGDSNSPGDPIGGAALLLVAGLMSIPIAVRFSRGRVWLTLLLTYAATFIPGLFFVVVLPGLGLYSAYLSMAVVLLARCGGWAWLSGTAVIAWNRIREPKEAEPKTATREDVKRVSAWLRRSDDECRTAEILNSLPSDFTVFHDVRVKGSFSALGHLVVGPSGAFLLASVDSQEELKDDPRFGITIPGIPMDQVVGTLLEQRYLLSRTLKCLERDFALLVIVHGEGLEDTRKTAAVFDPKDPGLPIAQVSVLGSGRLLEEINPGYGIWSSWKVAQTARRAQMKLSPATAPAPIKGSPTMKRPPLLASLDEDGNPTHEPGNGETSTDVDWIEPGSQVNIYTSKGMLTGLRVVGPPFTDEYGRAVVSLCVEEEWESALKVGRNPKVYPYPANAVSPQA